MNAQLIITMRGGQIQVTGPIGNKLLALGLLELAKEVVLKFDASAPPPVEEATGEVARRLLSEAMARGRNGE